MRSKGRRFPSRSDPASGKASAYLTNGLCVRPSRWAVPSGALTGSNDALSRVWRWGSEADGAAPVGSDRHQGESIVRSQWFRAARLGPIAKRRDRRNFTDTVATALSQRIGRDQIGPPASRSRHRPQPSPEGRSKPETIPVLKPHIAHESYRSSLATKSAHGRPSPQTRLHVAGPTGVSYMRGSYGRPDYPNRTVEGCSITIHVWDQRWRRVGGRSRFSAWVLAAADVRVEPSGREAQCVRSGKGAGERGGGSAAREMPTCWVPLAARVTGRYGVGTLDRRAHGPVVIGAPLGETPSPPAGCC